MTESKAKLWIFCGVLLAAISNFFSGGLPGFHVWLMLPVIMVVCGVLMMWIIQNKASRRSNEN